MPSRFSAVQTSADLCCPEQEFPSSEAMRMNRDSTPSRNDVFERLCVLHYAFSDCCYFDVSKLHLDSACDLP